jgi:hypothetical protein
MSTAEAGGHKRQQMQVLRVKSLKPRELRELEQYNPPSPPFLKYCQGEDLLERNKLILYNATALCYLRFHLVCLDCGIRDATPLFPPNTTFLVLHLVIH